MRKPKIPLAAVISLVLFVVNGVLAQQTPPKMILEGGVLNGKATSLPKPEYPEEAKAAKVGGMISVEVTIDEGGNVISAKAITTPGTNSKETMTVEEEEQSRLRSLLATAAEDAAIRATFSPTLLSGVPVKVTGRIVYNFVPGNDDKTSRPINGGVLNGKAISLPNPAYPPAAKAVNASGAVSVQITIDENGDVIQATAVSGHPLLQAAAVAAARGAKFSPTSLNGEPVKVTGIITYNFTLPKRSRTNSHPFSSSATSRTASTRRFRRSLYAADAKRS